MKNLDRTSWIGVIVCLALLFGWGWYESKNAAEVAAERARIAKIEAEKKALEEKNAPKTAATEDAPETTDTAAPDTPEAAPEKSVTLENEALILNLTSRGAGIKTAELLNHKRYLEGDGLVTINETAKNGVGVLSTGYGQFDTANWSLKNQDTTSATFETRTEDGFALQKSFRFIDEEGAEPHEVQMELTIRNDAQTPLSFANKFLYAGSAAPLHLNEWSMQMGMYWMEVDGKFEYETVDHYGGRKFLGIGKSDKDFDTFAVSQLAWAGVNDQFFTTIVQPEAPYEAKLWGSRIPVVVEGDEEASKEKRMFAAEGGIGLPVMTMNPGDQQTIRYRIYLGPKEYSRLKDMGNKLDRVMHYDEIPIFGWLFGWAIKPLASWLIQGLVFLEGYVGNYGIAIIIITILIRLLIWPVYAKSARSMKRMSKLTPLMKDIKEKYADDPQKMNQETMKLYQTYGINPLGGCLPMFIQLPVFLAFYRMLWSAVELRHESFLWVDDLAMPDTLFDMPFSLPFLGSGFNLLPILMGITSFIQIAITPKTGDKTQRMIFMLMPVMFLFFCYNFAAALALYWTVSNIFSILQTWIMNKMPEPELTKKATSGKKGFMARMQEQAEAAQRAKAAGGGGGGGNSRDRTKMPGEKGDRHTKGKKKRR